MAARTRKKSSAARTRKPKPAVREKVREDRVASLAAVFQALGARDPKRWARAHAKGGSDELARFVLLRAAWLKVLEPGRLLARAHADQELRVVVDRLLKKVDLADLDALVRATQAHALRDLLTVLDDPADEEQGISWGVYRRDKKGAPAARLGRLVEDLDAARP